MTSFGWKRKLGDKICKDKVQKFSSESQDNDENNDEVDWLNLVPSKKALFIEDHIAKSERLKKEGIVLAEAERFWEAINKWNEAIQLTPNNNTLMEMKAQALMSVGEVFPALQAAQKTVQLAPTWWVGHETLGRALINIGEVKMALKSFCRAVHLNPGEREVWEEDLLWAHSLLLRKESTSNGANETQKKTTGITIKELRDEEESEEGEKTDSSKKCDQLISYSHVMNIESEEESPVQPSLVTIPSNYVHMRDPM